MKKTLLAMFCMMLMFNVGCSVTKYLKCPKIRCPFKKQTSCKVSEKTAHKIMPASTKPSPEKAIAILKEGNARFVAGKSLHPNADSKRLLLSGNADQGDYAYATVITCSDSRVPVETIFDAGVMDIFVIRVAGNVCNVDEIGSIEYGLAHVRTPVLIVLGHTKCGAVTAVTHAFHGKCHRLERNIPPLIKGI